jgi:hypothetical protein
MNYEFKRPRAQLLNQQCGLAPLSVKVKAKAEAKAKKAEAKAKARSRKSLCHHSEKSKSFST